MFCANTRFTRVCSCAAGNENKPNGRRAFVRIERGAEYDAVGALVSKYVSARRSDAVRLAYVIVESRAQELDDGYYYCFQTFQLPVNRRSNSFVVFFVHHRSFALVSHKSYLRCILLKLRFM